MSFFHTIFTALAHVEPSVVIISNSLIKDTEMTTDSLTSAKAVADNALGDVLVFAGSVGAELGDVESKAVVLRAEAQRTVDSVQEWYASAQRDVAAAVDVVVSAVAPQSQSARAGPVLMAHIERELKSVHEQLQLKALVLPSSSDQWLRAKPVDAIVRVFALWDVLEEHVRRDFGTVKPHIYRVLILASKLARRHPWVFKRVVSLILGLVMPAISPTLAPILVDIFRLIFPDFPAFDLGMS